MEKMHSRMAFDLSEREFTSIDEFRKKANTAVLTIMFTDIQGFTALTENKGESYVHKLHEAHDRILVETIESDGDGIVIKFIGDSIMAVFSEPTAAARKALLIQQRLADFNAQHSEIDDITVRIGLHMGQTVIENKIQTDLFGRHVNKASRIEGLASGGHIYLSYPVFDSVKGWIMDIPNARSKLHGSYFLKGIDKAEEIYEIWDERFTVPEAPRNARKLSPVSGRVLFATALIAFVLIGAGALLAVRARETPEKTKIADIEHVKSNDAIGSGEPEIASTTGSRDEPDTAKVPETKSVPMVEEKAPEIYFLGMNAREPILDFATPLAVSVENEAQGLKKSINDIEAGKHVIHYVVSYMVRYYAEFVVKPGKNVIQIAFKESRLPSADIHYNLGADGTEEKLRKQEGSYFLYDRTTKRQIAYTSSVFASVKGVKSAEDKVVFTIAYKVLLNGKEVAKNEILVTSDPAATEWTRMPERILYSEGDHYYYVRYEYIGETIQASVGASFKD